MSSVGLDVFMSCHTRMIVECNRGVGCLMQEGCAQMCWTAGGVYELLTHMCDALVGRLVAGLGPAMHMRTFEFGLGWRATSR